MEAYRYVCVRHIHILTRRSRHVRQHVMTCAYMCVCVMTCAYMRVCVMTCACMSSNEATRNRPCIEICSLHTPIYIQVCIPLRNPHISHIFYNLCVCVCVCINIHIYRYIYMCMRVYICTYIYTYIYICIHVDKYMHNHTHTHTHTSAKN